MSQCASPRRRPPALLPSPVPSSMPSSPSSPPRRAALPPWRARCTSLRLPSRLPCVAVGISPPSPLHRYRVACAVAVAHQPYVRRAAFNGRTDGGSILIYVRARGTSISLAGRPTSRRTRSRKFLLLSRRAVRVTTRRADLERRFCVAIFRGAQPPLRVATLTSSEQLQYLEVRVPDTALVGRFHFRTVVRAMR